MSFTLEEAGPHRIDWTWGRLDALTVQDVYELLALRSEVFVLEQGCVFLDADGVDKHAWHLLARNQAGELLAYLRLVDAGVKYPEVSIGRVITSPRARGIGLGKLLMREALERTMQVHPQASIRISAQARLHDFYAALGFTVQSEPYIEDGIAHIQMLRLPSTTSFIPQA